MFLSGWTENFRIAKILSGVASVSGFLWIVLVAVKAKGIGSRDDNRPCNSSNARNGRWDTLFFSWQPPEWFLQQMSRNFLASPTAGPGWNVWETNECGRFLSGQLAARCPMLLQYKSMVGSADFSWHIRVWRRPVCSTPIARVCDERLEIHKRPLHSI